MNRRTIADARLKKLQAEVVRGVALAATRRAEELRDETRAMRAAIAQRRRLDARRRGRTTTEERTPARH